MQDCERASPSAAVIDSHSVKTTRSNDIEGYDAGIKTDRNDARGLAQITRTG